MKHFLAYLSRVDRHWDNFSEIRYADGNRQILTSRKRRSLTWGQSLFVAIGSSILPLMSTQLVQAAPITCPQIYGSYNNGTVYNSLRTYDPLTATVSAEIAALTDGAGGTPAIAALAVDPILTTTGRRRVYYTENVNTTTRLFYYDGVSVVNTGVTLALAQLTNSVTQSDGTVITTGLTTFNRMAFAPDGTLYIADGQKTFYRFSPDRFGTGGTLSAATTIVDNANNDSGNSFRARVDKSAGGDITFDNQGRMYIVTYDPNGSNVPTEFRLFQVLNPTVSSPQAVLLGKQATTDPVAGLTFSSSDNKLYMQGSGGKSFSWDLGLNSVTALTQVSPGSADLSSCSYPNLDPVNTVTKTVANITNPAATALTANDILEYTISIANTGNLVAGNATLLDLIPGGSTYVLASTKLNGATLTDGAGSTMPYANSTTFKPINSPGQANGVLLAGATNKATVVFRVKVTASNTNICNQGIFKYDGGPGSGLFSNDPTTTQSSDPTCVGTVAVVSNPLTCGVIYGSYSNGTTFNSLRTYNPATSTVGTAIAALTDGAGGTPAIAALSVDPILDTNGRRRIYYTENIQATTRLFYYDGVSVVNTGITLLRTVVTNNITRSDGTPASSGNSFNRMGFAPDGTLYIADGQSTLYRFIPNRGSTGGSLSGAITISDNANNDAGNNFRAQVGKSAGGDITFDNQGRMYIVTYDANASNVPTEFRLFQILDPTTSTPQAVLLGRSPSLDPVAGLTFQASDNKLYMQASGGKSFSWDLGTNALTTLTTVSPGSADLGGCNYPNLSPISDASTVQKTVTNITNPTATALTANDILQYTIEISNTGNLAAGNATLVDLIPSGSTYVAASTKLNNLALTDGAGSTMPYANSVTPKPINTLGQASGVLLTGAANKATVVFRVKVSASNIRICNQGTYKYDGGPTNGILSDNPGTANVVGDSTCMGRVATNANVSIIKRITAINGLTTNSIDSTDLSLPDNTIPNWPTNYLKGATNGGKVKPGDEIEYTIYFLNDGGGNANSVRICDRINPNQTLQTTTYGTPNLGMKLQIGALTNPPTTLTTIDDPTIDRAQFIAAGGAVPTDCHLPGINDNGTAMLDLTGTTGSPSLTTLSNNAYGFWRFTTKVNISP